MIQIKALEKRDKEEEEELHKFIENENLPASPTSSVQSGIVGRQTGTAEWRAARGEDGTRH
jgi:hypothetical protein